MICQRKTTERRKKKANILFNMNKLSEYVVKKINKQKKKKFLRFPFVLYLPFLFSLNVVLGVNSGIVTNRVIGIGGMSPFVALFKLDSYPATCFALTKCVTMTASKGCGDTFKGVAC